MTSSFSITPAEFREFSTFLEKSCGILLAEHKQYLVQSRLGKIMQQQGCTNLNELVTRLNRPGGGTLKEQVIDAMTTNETLWFRDIHPYEILRNKLLPELHASSRFQKLRIWSAACSTGQEPYSISMVIDEFKQQTPGAFSSGEEILATDISSTVLDQARRGEYEMLALGRGLSQDRLHKFFQSTESGSWTIAPKIKSRVRFQSMNLLGPYGALGQFDLIFIRNVLIYFSSDVKLEILRKMHRQLRPGGYLLLGASESLSGLSDLYKMIHCRPGIIYQAI
ncbi:MAG: protein-glutamate O-methyltransferase CheR [Oceanospirillales bacterium]|uniref:Chemotaxis protein methyltransferase n=1 Tax=Marinobacterium halophilum TaxID=267374 RepID=A0A2P8ES89_9GAMM|nr:protein-glutamate O-methyltransferase CheR [Marinobacterium halophilum]MBR9827665.1 protein-glutamate O-methyltransferase CheR [Oceanospirillales bacterium]PSL12330.1 CheR-type MCP methyltransferase [Marinobacterium halophilum]